MKWIDLIFRALQTLVCIFSCFAVMSKPTSYQTSRARANEKPASKTTPLTQYSTRTWGWDGTGFTCVCLWVRFSNSIRVFFSPCLLCAVCGESFPAGDAYPTGFCVASWPLRTQHLLRRDWADLWLLGIWQTDRGLVSFATQSETYTCNLLTRFAYIIGIHDSVDFGWSS